MAKVKKQKVKKNTNINQTVTNLPSNVSTPAVEEQVKISANNQFCSILHTSFFDEKQCNAILKSLVEELWKKGETVNPNNKINKDLRQVEEQIMPASSDGWPLTRILEFANQANNARFKFDLSGFLDIDAPMIMRYKKGCHYDWHIDTGNSVCHRKLSFSIQLSDSKDYEGGDIEFLGSKVKTEEFRQKGVAIIFPSFLPHRITKVTKGVRHAIVGWIHGPTFK